MPHQQVDAQTVTDTGLHVYEAIVTLEFTGRRPTRSAIADAARLADPVLDEALTGMAEQGLLTVSRDHGEPVYEPARRDWSTQPAQPVGHPME